MTYEGFKVYCIIFEEKIPEYADTAIIAAARSMKAIVLEYDEKYEAISHISCVDKDYNNFIREHGDIVNEIIY